MSLSRLLLVAASSKKYIEGEHKDRIVIKPADDAPSQDPFAGEVVLCFNLDNKRDREQRTLIEHSLNLSTTDQRCDGLIFYAADDKKDKVICLVEMKSKDIGEAAEQIRSTRDRVKALLRKECEGDCDRQFHSIKWKACFYHHGSSPRNVQNTLAQLKTDNFDGVKDFTASDNNAGPFLRGENQSAKEQSSKFKKKKRDRSSR